MAMPILTGASGCARRSNRAAVHEPDYADYAAHHTVDLQLSDGKLPESEWTLIAHDARP
jgi:hypothetical protein